MHQLGISFDPPVLNLGAILPGEPGRTNEETGEPELPLKPNEARFFMVNTSEKPIEVFCLDTDKRYLEEEEMLRHYEAFDDAKEILFDPRAGLGFPWSPIGAFPYFPFVGASPNPTSWLHTHFYSCSC